MFQLWCKKEHFRIAISRKICAIGFMLCIIGSSVASVHTFQTNSLRAEPELKQVSDWLEYQNYTKGYATFWNAGILTEWSNGKI